MTGSGAIHARERVSVWLFTHRKTLQSIFVGLLSGGALSLFSTRFNPAHFEPVGVQVYENAPFLGIVIFVLALLKRRASVIFALLCLVFLSFPVNAELGYISLFFAGFIGILSIFGVLESALVLVSPAIAHFSPLMIPILFGFLCKKKQGMLWSVLACLFTLAYASILGIGRLEIGGRDFATELAGGGLSPFSLPGNWYTHLFNNLNFGRYLERLGNLFTIYPITTIAHLFLWCLCAGLVSTLYVPQRFKDQLAEDYLRKAQSAKTGKNPIQKKTRTLPFAIAVSGLFFCFGNALLSLFVAVPGESFQYYRSMAPVLDVLAAGFLIGIFSFRYTGDPQQTALLEAASRGKHSHRKKPGTQPALPKKSSLFPPGSTHPLEDDEPRKPVSARIPSGKGTGERETVRVRLGSAADLGTLRPKSASLGTSEFSPLATESTPPPPPPSEPPPIEADYQVNEKIDGQYLINKIRRGGMGVVYIVTDEFSGKRYAVKSLPDEFTQDLEAKRRFEAEARTWINLDHHENIVQAMLYRVIKDRPLLFLEYIEGTDLEHLLNRNQRWPLAQVLHWCIQISRGMTYAHTKRFPDGRTGIIHRDLKPANIMITRDGIVKITDFGLAKIKDMATGLTREHSGLGTLMYMAPEQIESARDVDGRADIYSFGALFYEILTGKPPFTGDSVTAICAQIVSKAPTPPSRIRPDVTPGVDQIILKCLEKQKENRYLSFEDVERDLTDVAGRLTSPGSFTLPQEVSIPETERVPTPSPSRLSPSPSTTGQVSRPVTAQTSPLPSSVGSGGVRAIEAVVFVDMVESTGKGIISDTLALELKEELAQVVTSHCEKFGFSSRKGTGDGYMLTFPSCRQAVDACTGIMRDVSSRNDAVKDRHRRIDLRMGIHYGEVLIDTSQDRQGSTCNFADRVQGVRPADFHQTRMGVSLDELKQENRIFCSEVVHQELQKTGQPATSGRLVGFFDLKGFPGRHRVFEVLWK